MSQIENGYPGFYQEVKTYISDFNLTDITSEHVTKEAWKRQVKQSIIDKNVTELIFEMIKSEKVKEYISETFERKSYFKDLNLIEARAIFKKRAKMTQYVKMNYPSDPVFRKELWQCSGCSTKMDTMSHVLWCSGYSNLRENLDLDSDKDLAKYLLEVEKIRSKSNNSN